MIHFRKEHPVLRKHTKEACCGFPDISVHNDVPWNDTCNSETRCISLMYAGRKENQEEDDIVYVAVNKYRGDGSLTLAKLTGGMVWKIKADTAAKYDKAWQSWELGEVIDECKIQIRARSVMILVAEKR